MYIIINRQSRKVFAIETVKPPENSYNELIFETREEDENIPKIDDIVDEYSVDELKAICVKFAIKIRDNKRKQLNLTDGYFQQLFYSEKFQQAKNWLNDKSEKFYFELEANVRGITKEEMATLIVNQGELLLNKSDEIEAEYFTALKRIENIQNIQDGENLLLELKIGD